MDGGLRSAENPNNPTQSHHGRFHRGGYTAVVAGVLLHVGARPSRISARALDTVSRFCMIDDAPGMSSSQSDERSIP